MKGPIAAAALLLGAVGPGPAAAGSAALPQISAVPVEDGMRLEASLIGLSPGEVTATFTIERTENGNLVRSSQSRTLPVAPGERRMVAETTLSLDPSADLTADLVLRSGEVMLGDAQLRIGTDVERP